MIKKTPIEKLTGKAAEALRKKIDDDLMKIHSPPTTITAEAVRAAKEAMDAAAISGPMYYYPPDMQTEWFGITQDVVQEIKAIKDIAGLDNDRMLDILKNLRRKYEDSVSGD